MPEKKRGRPSDKTESQLRKEYVEKTEHDIDQINNWSMKLARNLSSTTYPFNDTQKKAALEAAKEIYDRLVAKVTKPETPIAKGFKF